MRSVIMLGEVRGYICVRAKNVRWHPSRMHFREWPLDVLPEFVHYQQNATEEQKYPHQLSAQFENSFSMVEL